MNRSITLAAALFGVWACSPLTAALPTTTGYWTFDAADISGATAFDRSGNNIFGSLSNTSAITGEIGQALSFNGSSSQVALNNENGQTQLTAALTWTVWIKTSNSLRYEALISKYDAGGFENGYLIKTTPSGTLNVRLGLSAIASNQPRELVDTTRINDGQWHHIVVVLTPGQGVTFYVDGALSSTQNTNIVPSTSGVPTLFGYDLYYAAAYTGALDDVRLYRQALTAAQVAELFSTTSITPPPVISSVQSSNVTTTTATISWLTDVPADTQVEYGFDLNYGLSSTLNPSLVNSHVVNLTGLAASRTYHYRVRSRSGSLAISNDFRFTTPAPSSGSGTSVSDTTAADFRSGSGANTYVSQMGDGEVILNPRIGTEFDGTSLPDGWTNKIWFAGGTTTIANGVALMDGTLLYHNTAVGPGTSLEFGALINAEVDQNAGFGIDFQSPPWAIFSTQSNRLINIRTSNGSSFLGQTIGSGPLGAMRKYRLDWTASGVTFWIDGVQVGSQANVISQSMFPMFSENFPGGLTMTLDWVHASPYASSATFTSRVLDAGSVVNWGAVGWTADTPTGTSVLLTFRTGNTPVPDGTWTSYVTVGQGASLGQSTRYVQYQALLSTSDTTQTPVLRDVTLQFNSVISNVSAGNIGTGGATLTWTTNIPTDGQVEYGTTAAYGSLSALNATPLTSHSVALSGLAPGTLYHYRVRSRDASLNLSVSGDFTFTTLSVPDNTLPTVSLTAPSAGPVAGAVTVSAFANDNVGVAGVQFLLDNANLGAEVTSAPYTIQWDTTLTANGNHSLSARVRDFAGNTNLAAPVAVSVSNSLTRTLRDTTVSDFSAGSGSNIYISSIQDGEVIHSPALAAEFNSLPAGWSSIPWSSGGGVTFSNGNVVVDGTLLRSNATFTQGRSLEFTATFSGDASQHGGFAVDLQGAPWAIFSTFGGGALYARTNNGTQSFVTQIAGNPLNAPHLYRIDWNNNGFVYWVDGVQVASHALAIPDQMRPLFSDASVAGGTVQVDWLRMSPYAPTATFVSRVFDAGTQVNWGMINWTADTPAGGSIAMRVRTGNTPVPDGTWSALAVVTSGASVGASTRYLQYQATLSTADTSKTNVLRDVTLQYDLGGLFSVQAGNLTTTGATITWSTTSAGDGQVDYGLTNTYGSSSALNPALVTNHSVTLAGLAPGTLYHFRVKSNVSGSLLASGDYTFTTVAVPDTTFPTVSLTAPANNAAIVGTTILSANAGDNVAVAGVQILLDGAPLGAEVTTPASPGVYTFSWVSNGTPNGPHTLAARARDTSNNQTTSTPAVNVTLNNPVISTLTDTTAADFAAGTPTNTYVSQVSDGEVIQAPTLATEFSSMPSGWTTSPWGTGGAATINSGSVVVNGAMLASNGFYSAGRSLEFAATFSSDASQHAGFATDLQSSPWAIFSTFGGGALYARTNSGSRSANTLLPGSYLNAPHRFRIDWNANGVVYSIDGVPVQTDGIGISATMRPVISDATPTGGAITVDWLRLSPYAAPATFTSRVLDAGAAVHWNSLAWNATLPAGTAVALSYRTGASPVPDGTWSAFTPVAASGGALTGLTRYIQYQAAFSTTDLSYTAALNDVTVSFAP